MEGRRGLLCPTLAERTMADAVVANASVFSWSWFVGGALEARGGALRKLRRASGVRKCFGDECPAALEEDEVFERIEGSTLMPDESDVVLLLFNMIKVLGASRTGVGITLDATKMILLLEESTAGLGVVVWFTDGDDDNDDDECDRDEDEDKGKNFAVAGDMRPRLMTSLVGVADRDDVLAGEVGWMKWC